VYVIVLVLVFDLDFVLDVVAAVALAVAPRVFAAVTTRRPRDLAVVVVEATCVFSVVAVRRLAIAAVRCECVL
jgi:hypothetical protein